MKNSLFIICALLVGLVLGSWSVKSDLRQARQENAALKEDLNRRGQRENSLRNITTMLRVPEPVRRHESAAAAASTNAPTPDSGAPPAQRVPLAATTVSPAAKSREDQLQTAMELWKTRSALARNSFLSNIAASPVQSQMFDQTVATMNQQLGDKIKEWVTYLKEQKEVTPETGVRMMNDLSATVVAGYDELDRVLTPDWRDKAGREFQLFDFINPDVALPLKDVENFPKMQPRRPPAP